MHELGIATEIIRTVQDQATRNGPLRIDEIGLRIGAMSGVDPEALRFAIEASTIDTPLNGVRVAIERVPVRAACNTCSGAMEVNEFVFICDLCGSRDLRITQGDELDITYVSGQT
jgi:hydrogenase nickel incorporation protein HypA/HybF